MSRKELIQIACRVFALYLTTWGLVEVTYVPDRLYSLLHHMNQHSVLETYDYWSKYYFIYDAFIAVRMFGLFTAAVLFWKCGPRVEALFLPQPGNEETPSQDSDGVLPKP
jgi:hypothetical protein